MKGHMQDGKFHPHTDYKKGVRMLRDQKAKTKGIRFKKESETEKLTQILINRSGLEENEIDQLIDKKIDTVGKRFLTNQGAVFLVADDLKISLSGKDPDKPLRIMNGMAENIKISARLWKDGNFSNNDLKNLQKWIDVLQREHDNLWKRIN